MKAKDPRLRLDTFRVLLTAPGPAMALHRVPWEQHPVTGLLLATGLPLTTGFRRVPGLLDMALRTRTGASPGIQASLITALHQ